MIVRMPYRIKGKFNAYNIHNNLAPTVRLEHNLKFIKNFIYIFS